MRGDINVSLECFIILDTAGCGNYLRNESFGTHKEFSFRENVNSSLFKLPISDV